MLFIIFYQIFIIGYFVHNNKQIGFSSLTVIDNDIKLLA